MKQKALRIYADKHFVLERRICLAEFYVNRDYRQAGDCNMTNYEAVSIAEGFCDHKPDEAEQIEAWQHLIDTGLAWILQGWFGRNAQSLIEQCICRKAGKVR